jgi:hypothetical protein
MRVAQCLNRGCRPWLEFVLKDDKAQEAEARLGLFTAMRWDESQGELQKMVGLPFHFLSFEP